MFRPTLLFLCSSMYSFSTLSLRMHNSNIHYSNIIKSNNIQTIQNYNKWRWETVTETKEIVMLKYFEQTINTSQKCEIFCIEGVPAASMLYTDINDKKNPLVYSFHINKELIMLFDAGPYMRLTLYKRYKHIDIKNAINKNDFIII